MDGFQKLKKALQRHFDEMQEGQHIYISNVSRIGTDLNYEEIDGK